MPAKTRAQMGLEEKVVEDADLLAALEEWQEAKEEASEAAKTVKKRRDVVDQRLGKYAMTPGEELRCGAFLISCTEIDEAEVSFTRSAAEKVNIRNTAKK